MEAFKTDRKSKNFCKEWKILQISINGCLFQLLLRNLSEFFQITPKTFIKQQFQDTLVILYLKLALTSVFLKRSHGWLIPIHLKSNWIFDMRFENLVYLVYINTQVFNKTRRRLNGCIKNISLFSVPNLSQYSQTFRIILSFLLLFISKYPERNISLYSIHNKIILNLLNVINTFCQRC